MRRLRAAGVALATGLILASAGPGAAQTRAPGRAASPPAAPAPEPEPAPPYESELLRLAEIVGALTHLRDLCGMNDGADWRARMAQLLATEGVTPQRRDRLAGAFNRGFRLYGDIHRTCTAAAGVAIQRFVDEGARLSRELANRYSG